MKRGIDSVMDYYFLIKKSEGILKNQPYFCILFSFSVPVSIARLDRNVGSGIPLESCDFDASRSQEVEKTHFLPQAGKLHAASL